MTVLRLAGMPMSVKNIKMKKTPISSDPLSLLARFGKRIGKRTDRVVNRMYFCPRIDLTTR